MFKQWQQNPQIHTQAYKSDRNGDYIGGSDLLPIQLHNIRNE